jgi:DNA replication and repair protein RecF
MHLAHLRLRDFRNYCRLDADFPPGFHLFRGDNAQGKTNLLEAIYLLATLRSFRGVGGSHLIRLGQKGYFVGANVLGQERHEIKVFWSVRERQINLDGQPVRRLTDYLGILRVVVFCSEDVQLVKGPARGRRRLLDLLLSQTSAAFLPLRQRYARALRSRNALLKQASPDDALLASYTQELVRLGSQITAQRRELVPRLAPLASEAYRRIAPAAEELRLEYQPAVRQDMAAELAQSRARERIYRTTLIGPHRDELELYLDNQSAAQYGSEGQKRTVAIALKMAQAEYLTTRHGIPPILLLDDVMGELDEKRRRGFLPLLARVHQARSQVFMTCTEPNWPHEIGGDLHHWTVQQGTLGVLAGG